MVPKNAKRFLLAVGLALLPGVAGASGFGAAGDSFWARLDPMALFERAWDGLTSVWMGGGSVDPNGEGTNGAEDGDGGGSVDPNG